jgi:multimeric flavodoxin WrbA
VAKVLVLYYSAYKRVPETVPLEIARSANFKLDQEAPVATIDELANYDAIVVGTGTRFGRLDEITGGTPYGATTIAGADGSRQPSELDLAGARYQGELVARTAARLFD